jgi:hypothetical protein
MKGVMNRRNWFVYLAAIPIVLLAKEDPWKEGTLVSIDIRDIGLGKKVTHRYVCTVSDGAFNYVGEYEKPLKLAVNGPVRFELKKNNITIVDADGKKRSTQIEKRERVAAPPPAPPPTR